MDRMLKSDWTRHYSPVPTGPNDKGLITSFIAATNDIVEPSHMTRSYPVVIFLPTFLAAV